MTAVETSEIGTDVVARRFRLRLPRWDVFLGLAVAAALFHATGMFGDWIMVALSVATPVAIAAAVRFYRPSVPWPWVLLICAGIAWSAAGGVRAAVGATGDLSTHRNLLPDVFAVAGYTLFAVALLQMLRAQGQATRAQSLVLDGGILALSAMLVCWVALISPVLFRLDAAPVAKVSIVIYPPISAALVWIAARMAFGTADRGTSQRLLLAGMLALLIGDVAYVPLETHLMAGAPGRLFELPYALAYALIGAAALHPSMLGTVRRKASLPVVTDRRFALIMVALLTPALILFVWSPVTLAERIVVGLLAVALALAATARVILAARTQALVEEGLDYRATRDELTGLLNRAAIHEVVNRHLDDIRTTAEPLALLFIDLDRFKLVNDSYGHAVGDELLLAAADRLRTSVDPTDTVSRLSGDEFLVVLPSSGLVRATEIAARVCDVFAMPFELVGTAWVSASIGVVLAEGELGNTDASSLIRDADTAMYVAKGAGKAGFAVFDPSMRAQSEHMMEMLNGLHLAIERDEFEAHYQVIVDSTSGLVHGVEALVRWRAPDGMVSPDKFISLAEDSGLISAIGEIVLRESCAQVVRWRQLPGCADLTLSVNVSALQILDGDMVSLVADVLEQSGLDPNAVWLEITESVMMTDTLDTLATLSGLRTLGVHLSVDDFGTGFSSLSYLQRYPVEQVKIDRHFVGRMLEHSEDAAVVAAVIGIADALGLSVVAEGVETKEHVDHLRALDCQLVQGFLYSRPMPAIDLGPILLERNELPFRPPGHRRL